jgi:Ca2+/Na+ antiporter
MAESRWSLRNIYLYLVCLITLMMVIVGAASAVRSVVELTYPDPYSYSYYSAPIPIEKGGSGELTPQERAEQERLQKAQSTRQGVLSLVGNLAMVFIAGPLYVYHWRKIEAEIAESPADAPAPAA